MSRPSDDRSDRFMLWIDAVGGYWVCLDDEVSFGPPGGPGRVDVPVLGDLATRHARIRRDGESYLVEAVRPVRVDGHPVRGMAMLADGNTIELGGVVRMVFRRPHPLSATARLDFLSRHRTQPSSDAILLMAESCVLGPRSSCHVVCRHWTENVILHRQGSALFCRTSGPVEIDGKQYKGQGPISRNSRIEGARFSLSLEPL